MQPLTRRAPRLLFDSIRAPLILNKPCSGYCRSCSRATACPKCLILSQVRQFVEGQKHSRSSTSISHYSTANAESESTVNSNDENSRLPSDEAGRRHAVTKRFSHLMDRIQGNIFTASQRINDITGYSGIEILKDRIRILEGGLQTAQTAVRTARFTYKETVTNRASTQREVTTLLARKDSWTPSDLERFTTLYRMDHSNEQAVQEAATQLANAEADVEQASSQLRNTILSRYHEEQIWSDKIRRMSTWGTWGLMGVNVLLFLVFQFGLEPWRRKRLIQGFENKVLEALEIDKKSKNPDTIDLDHARSEIDTTKTQDTDMIMENKDSLASTTTTADIGFVEGENQEETGFLDSSNQSFLKKMRFYGSNSLDSYAAVLKDLFSDRVIEIRQQDIAVLALESAAIGAAIVTTIFASILLHS
ncbi:Sensitive to high expression protein 9-like protein, mitochondrial [Golovinomyces cichoracearum]|uniref:Sensitive to high expression protein 9, mitochondrial n=1 Tax=Golovinomyces cichoracearum TaxID=62708 RepID=A0A420HIY5_9PEZI|nr:Sensitive to high expression protein 9-like protein, mitochondrial [Golovinomyces cichoracearum]